METYLFSVIAFVYLVVPQQTYAERMEIALALLISAIILLVKDKIEERGIAAFVTAISAVVGTFGLMVTTDGVIRYTDRSVIFTAISFAGFALIHFADVAASINTVIASRFKNRDKKFR